MNVQLLDLWLPIVLSGVGIFFGSFLSWMVLQLHKQDWQRLKREDEFLSDLRGINPPLGSFMFPSCDNQKDMQSEEFQKKWSEGPRGIITLFPPHNMGRNLALTMVVFLVVNAVLAFLATLAFRRGESFQTIFTFFAVASVLVYLTGIVQQKGDALILERPEGAFLLRVEWLERVRPVDPRVRGVLLGADYVLPIRPDDLPASATPKQLHDLGLRAGRRGRT